MKIRHSIHATTAMLAVLATLAGSAFSDVWVSAAGNDANDGLSSGAPKLTLAAAIPVWNGQSVGSDLHVVGGGAFTEANVYDITINGQTGNSARIFGDGGVATLRSMVFNIIGASVEFSNLVLECTGATQGAFRIQNTGTNLTLNQLSVYGDPHCIHIDDGQGSGTLVDGLTISNSYLQAANNGDALNIDVGVQTTNLTLDGVTVLRLGTAGGGNEVAVSDTTLPSRNITIRDCNIVAAELANPNACTLVISGSPGTNFLVENTVVFTAANFALRNGGFTDGMIVRDCTLTSWYTTIQCYNAPIKHLTIENCSLNLTGTRNADRNDNIALEQTWTVPGWVSNAVEGCAIASCPGAAAAST